MKDKLKRLCTVTTDKSVLYVGVIKHLYKQQEFYHAYLHTAIEVLDIVRTEVCVER